jgi:ATP-dependent DNA helicase HFM1/MER3
MPNPSNFLNSLERLSSLAYHDDSQARHSPVLQDLPNTDPDVPLDAFDKELLAESPPEPLEAIEYGQTRRSLPPRAMLAPARTVDEVKMLREDIYSAPIPYHRSSSSSVAAASSPTVLALQNRQILRAPGSSRTSITKTGGAGRFKEHAGGVVTPEVARYPQSSQGRSTAVLQPKAESSAKTQGSATRMGLGHAPPIIQGVPLIATTELPDRYRSIFPFPVFNAVQSKCFAVAFGSNENLIVSAPTGSGKTAIMELAICQLMMASNADDFKVVYQAPTKSLCAERMRDWTGKFASLDLKCAELTGDTEQAQLKNVQSASIIITTPEKWDSVTRKWKDNAKLMKLVKLFLIDEVHILKETRGATLEAVVSRMKSVGSDVRFVALSATVPNSEDIATWLGRAPDAQHLSAHREVFGEEFRPVKLEKHVWGIRGPANDFAFDRVLDDSLRTAIAQHSKKKPTMIFCTTRKMAADTAKMLAELFHATAWSRRLWPAPKKSYRMVDQELSKLVTAGVAFHHGGVDAADRRSIEDGFLSSDITIICCTSTLAVGVNLPCYFVVIKGTVAWTDKGAQEYPDLEIMQMLGRAGRPQFETSACAVILTRPEKENHYKKMVSGEEILESSLHLNLVDHLNSEIGLGTVKDMASAKKWLAGTFMFVRLQRNPRHYQLEQQVDQSGTDELLGSICAKDIGLLQGSRLVSQGSTFRCTEFGDAMARYYVNFHTMKSILAMAPKAKMSEVVSSVILT